jgi:hypothetical protein
LPTLRAAQIAEQDASGAVLDFHALRHTYITNLASSGVHPKIAQKLARHSTIALTMDRYTHLQEREVVDAVGSVPVISPQVGKLYGRQYGREYGNTGVRGCPDVSADGRETIPSSVKTETPNVLQSNTLGVVCPPMSAGVIQKAPPGFEPGMVDLQFPERLSERWTAERVGERGGAGLPFCLPVAGCGDRII